MLCLIFIPGLQSASPQGASVSLSPPPALAVLSVFHNPQNEAGFWKDVSHLT